MAGNTKTDLLQGGISVRNAGIVLLNSYIPIFFERLQLTANGRFSSNENQLAAVHYLQYLSTGISHTDEAFLSLNKILCGIRLTQPITAGIEINAAETKLIEVMFQSIISHWPAVGQSSIDGFRGNWLVRDGLLTEKEDRWALRIDKRPYDLLINKSPFAFSIIKYPWMDKPLHVNWPY